MADIHGNLNSDEKMKHLDILNIRKPNFYQILNIIRITKFAILLRESRLWNNHTDKLLKTTKSRSPHEPKKYFHLFQ